MDHECPQGGGGGGGNFKMGCFKCGTRHISRDRPYLSSGVGGGGLRTCRKVDTVIKKHYYVFRHFLLFYIEAKRDTRPGMAVMVVEDLELATKYVYRKRF